MSMALGVLEMLLGVYSESDESQRDSDLASARKGRAGNQQAALCHDCIQKKEKSSGINRALYSSLENMTRPPKTVPLEHSQTIPGSIPSLQCF